MRHIVESKWAVDFKYTFRKDFRGFLSPILDHDGNEITTDIYKTSLFN